MGLEKAKSLLVVKDGKTFLDLIAEQVRTAPRVARMCTFLCACRGAGDLDLEHCEEYAVSSARALWVPLCRRVASPPCTESTCWAMRPSSGEWPAFRLGRR